MKRGTWFAAVLITVTLLAGCATVGRDTFNLAQEAWSNNRPIEALVLATESLLENPDLTSAKSFLRDNTDTALSQARGFLSSTANTVVPDELAARFVMYGQLVSFYENLERIGMPIVADKRLFGLIKGWEWSTRIVDHRGDLEDARNAAREGFFNAGVARIQEGEIESAESLMRAVITRFAVEGSEEQQQDRQRIVTAFIDFAAMQHGLRDAQRLLQGFHAYEAALRFEPGNATAEAGRQALSLELSDVYLAMALEQERRNTIDSVTEAVRLFEESLVFNPANQDAHDGIPRARTRLASLYTDQGQQLERSGRIPDMIAAHESYEQALQWDGQYNRAVVAEQGVRQRIAEAYYQEGVRVSGNRSDLAAIDAGIAAFTAAQEWVFDYRDADLFVQRLIVSKELIAMGEVLGPIRTRFDQSSQRVTTLSRAVNNAYRGIADLNNIVERIDQLEGQLSAIGTASRAMASIPKVGAVFSVVGTSVRQVHTPVEAVNDKASMLQDPVLEPALAAMTTAKERMDTIVAAMSDVERSLTSANRMITSLNACVDRVTDVGALMQVQSDIRELQTAIGDLQSGLDRINTLEQELASALQTLSQGVSTISTVSRGVEAVMRPLDQISSVTDSITRALQQEFSIPRPLPGAGTYSVEYALASTTGAIAAAADRIIDPILRRLNIQVPQIPGIADLEQLLDAVEGYYADIRAAAAALERAEAEILAAPVQLRRNVDSISNATNCSL